MRHRHHGHARTNGGVQRGQGAQQLQRADQHRQREAAGLGGRAQHREGGPSRQSWPRMRRASSPAMSVDNYPDCGRSGTHEGDDGRAHTGRPHPRLVVW